MAGAGAPGARASGVAVVGPAAEPLYVRGSVSGGGGGNPDAAAGGAVPPDDQAQAHHLHQTAHCALDAVDDRLAHAKLLRGKVGGGTDPFLGLVHATELARVYAFVTSTRVKLLLVYDALGNGGPPRDQDVRDAFRRLHAAYADAVCNPFQPPGEPLRSTSFDAAVASLLRTG